MGGEESTIFNSNNSSPSNFQQFLNSAQNEWLYMERALQKERSHIFATPMHRIPISHEWEVSQQRTSAVQGTDTICCVYYIGLGMDSSYI